MRYYDHFVIPFTVGFIALFAVILYKYVRWYSILPRRDKLLVRKGLFTTATLGAGWEVVRESLLHRNIFKVNPLLGYMHMSLAFGWFLLIVMGWVEAAMHLTGNFVPVYAHVFFKYFAPPGDYRTSAYVMGTIMDILLLFVLSGVALAWFKRIRSRALGMRRATRHTLGDRIALSSLWLIFPLRLLAESAASGLKGTSTFLTGNIGEWMMDTFSFRAVYGLSSTFWWLYSIALAVFLISLPFSRYMHIFTEIPLVFLRRYGVRSGEKEKSFDHFQLEACSRCGICIDPCQLQKDAGMRDVQSVYFIRDRRYFRLTRETASNCLMCGRCEEKCPVGIELNTLRLNSREKYSGVPSDSRYDYLAGKDPSSGHGKVGYFAGCMTSLTPGIIRAMENIFNRAGEGVWYADRDGGICCGRPLKLSGEIEAARKMMDYNKELFRANGIQVLVTSCPICLKVFREDYALHKMEILHHSQYIEKLISAGRLSPVPGTGSYVYHDPCELGRGGGIYDEPRSVLKHVGTVVEPRENRENALCCGSSLANLEIGDASQVVIGAALACQLENTGAETIVTGCPLCKKAISRTAAIEVLDIAEIVAKKLQTDTPASPV